MKGRSARQEISALFAAYAAGFDDTDSEAVTELFAWPAVIWQQGQGHVFKSARELAENVEALIDLSDEAAIVSTKPEINEIRLAGATAFATVLWRQADEAGETLHEFTCRYLLLERDGRWRIAAIVNEEAADAA
jgi:ketosteroid isomerase-like protein